MTVAEAIRTLREPSPDAWRKVAIETLLRHAENTIPEPIAKALYVDDSRRLYVNDVHVYGHEDAYDLATHNEDTP